MKNRIWNEILDRIYPSNLYCICCRKIIDSSRTYRLCDDCMDSMKWVTGRCCVKCGRALSPNNPTDTCFNCREHRHQFDRGFACTEYGANEKAIVYKLKYDGRADIALPIGEMLADRMHAEFSEPPAEYDFVIPVPVSRRKLSLRGYNQAELIADSFAERTGLEKADIVRRVRETAKMKGLTPDERRANIRGSFDIREKDRAKPKGRSVLVIDDIYTTGATVDEIARLLKHCGADRVDFLSFASGADVVK